MKFFAQIDNGQGGSREIEAADAQEAMNIARQWAKEGEWKHDGEVYVEIFDQPKRPRLMPVAEESVAVMC